MVTSNLPFPPLGDDSDEFDIEDLLEESPISAACVRNIAKGLMANTQTLIALLARRGIIFSEIEWQEEYVRQLQALDQIWAQYAEELLEEDED